MKRLIILPAIFILLSGLSSHAQPNKLNDGNWADRYVVLKNTPEAEVMIRVGDIDNLNNGFEEGFNPFCGTTTNAHFYPWEVNSSDAAGTDRITVPSSYKGSSRCGDDGYTATTDRAYNKPEAIIMDIRPLAGMIIKSAALIMFVDDFQAPQFCSKFQMKLNGKRFYDAEKVLNALDQTGPVGKMITLPISEDLFEALKGNELSVLIDDPVSGAGDGYAIDFVKLIVNYKPQFTCIGKLKGVVLDQATGAPISGALVEVRGLGEATSDARGNFIVDKLPAGMQVAVATKEGYETTDKPADVSVEVREPITIFMKPARKTASYAGRQVMQGQSLVVNNMIFNQGSAELRKESIDELNKIVDFLQSNAQAQIELSGHTSSEGSRDVNRSLSFQRVNSCRNYITGKGIDADRISIAGYGPDRPIASNNSEEGRSKNRRVEMKVLRL